MKKKDEKELKKMARKLILIAKKNNQIKNVKEAFVDNPVNMEDHKGKLKYFCK